MAAACSSSAGRLSSEGGEQREAREEFFGSALEKRRRSGAVGEACADRWPRHRVPEYNRDRDRKWSAAVECFLATAGGRMIRTPFLDITDYSRRGACGLTRSYDLAVSLRTARRVPRRRGRPSRKRDLRRGGRASRHDSCAWPRPRLHGASRWRRATGEGAAR
jgi:hypothetical protein